MPIIMEVYAYGSYQTRLAPPDLYISGLLLFLLLFFFTLSPESSESSTNLFSSSINRVYQKVHFESQVRRREALAKSLPMYNSVTLKFIMHILIIPLLLGQGSHWLKMIFLSNHNDHKLSFHQPCTYRSHIASRKTERRNLHLAELLKCLYVSYNPLTEKCERSIREGRHTSSESLYLNRNTVQFGTISFAGSQALRCTIDIDKKLCVASIVAKVTSRNPMPELEIQCTIRGRNYELDISSLIIVAEFLARQQRPLV